MKQAWTLLILSSLVAIAAGLSACNKGGDNSPAPGPVVTTTALAAGSQIGFYAETRPLQSYFGGYYNNGYTGPSSLVIQGAWRTMLKEAMGVCDREHASGGGASCDSWAAGFNDIVIFFDGANANQPQMVIRSLYPQSSSPYYSYYYSLPSFGQLVLGLFGFGTYNPQGVFDPMILNSTVWPINNSQGFEVRAQGPNASQAYNKLIQVQVTTGKMEDPQFQFNLLYNGQAAASGTMIRCQTQKCGLQ